MFFSLTAVQLPIGDLALGDNPFFIWMSIFFEWIKLVCKRYSMFEWIIQIYRPGLSMNVFVNKNHELNLTNSEYIKEPTLIDVFLCLPSKALEQCLQKKHFAKSMRKRYICTKVWKPNMDNLFKWCHNITAEIPPHPPLLSWKPFSLLGLEPSQIFSRLEILECWGVLPGNHLPLPPY